MEDEWRKKNSKAMEQFQYMLKHEILTDCTFVVRHPPAPDKRFSCHKLMLARASSVFLAMMYGPMAEKGEDIIVDDIQCDAFSELITYIYTDAVHLQSCYQALGLCYAARKYMMHDLFQKCVHFLCNQIDPEHAWKGLELAMLLDEPRLRTKCISVMKQYTDAMLTTPDFEDIPRSTLEMLLNESELNVKDEFTLIEAVGRWANKEAERLGTSPRQALGEEALGSLRFLCLALFKVNHCSVFNTLLTKQERKAIKSNITRFRRAESMPQGFSTSRERRTTFHPISMYTLQRASLKSGPDYYASSRGESHVFRCSLTFHANLNFYLYGCEIFSQVRLGSTQDPIMESHDPNEPSTSRRGLDGPRSPQHKYRRSSRPNCSGGASTSNAGPSAEPSYQEHLTVSLLRVTSDPVAQAEVLSFVDFNNTVDFASTIRVMFPTPVYIEMKDKVRYCLRVSFYRHGKYPCRHSWSMIEHNNLKVVFSSTSYDIFTWGYSGVFSTLLFFSDEVDPPEENYEDSLGMLVPFFHPKNKRDNFR